MNLDDLLANPTYRIAAQQTVAAPRQVVWRELVALPMSALPLGFALTLLRHAPDVITGSERRVRGTDTFLDATPIPVLIDDAPRQIVSAGLSQACGRPIGGVSATIAIVAGSITASAEPRAR